MTREKQIDRPINLLEHGRFAFVVPVYNHPTSVAAVVKSALRFGAPVFVVDDGSTDRFDLSIEQLGGVTVIRHEQNLGKGAALRTGFQAAAKVSDWAIAVDADGQHNLDDLKSLLAALKEGFRGIVAGVRQGKEMDSARWTSRFGRGFSNFWVRASGGPRLKDTQNGFRIYPLPETLRLKTKADRYQFEVEVLVLAHWCGLPITQAPIGVTYNPQFGYSSHFRPFKDFLRNSKTFTGLIVKRLFLPKELRRRTHQIEDGG